MCARTTHEVAGGGQYFSILDVLFSRWVFIHLSLHESTTKVLGCQSRNENWIYFMSSNNKFLGKCWYGRHLWIQLAVECESMVEKGINFSFCLGTAYDISSMESIGNYSIVLVDGKSMPLKMFYLLIFALSSGTTTNPNFPLRRGFLFTLCNFYFYLNIYLLL